MPSLGNVSLCIAVTGLVAVETALRLHLVRGAAWQVIAQAFEASTIGGVADWFAVTALFRTVPLPIIRRHTNIIAKNRTRIVSAIADMVENRWLSPAVIREHLERFSASEQLLERFSDEADADRVISFLRGLFRKLASGLDRPEVSELLERALRERLQSSDLANPIGAWLGDAIREGDHDGIWETVLEWLEEATQSKEFRQMAGKLVDYIIQEYREGGFFQGWTLQAVESLRLFRKANMVDGLISKLEQLAQEARADPEHPLRARLDGMLLDYADGLAEGRPESVEGMDKVRRALAEGVDTREYVEKALHRLHDSIDSELAEEGSDLDQLLHHIFQEQLSRFRKDPETRETLDGWVREVITELVETRHKQIGIMVRSSLSKLSDEHLVAQIEDKVGADLQYIRLNGAVVGGLVGALLGIAKLFL
ncbi:MAG TPA: DUF445 domain-containing protein [Bryobacteraceae bacterium]|nr:DUF445 domain-containing protein [Bryobacteraceae bacterium]